jgi:hypothetical protein
MSWIIFDSFSLSSTLSLFLSLSPSLLMRQAATGENEVESIRDDDEQPFHDEL